MDDLTLRNLRSLEGHAKLQQERIDTLDVRLRNSEQQVAQLGVELRDLRTQFFMHMAKTQGTGPT